MVEIHKSTDWHSIRAASNITLKNYLHGLRKCLDEIEPQDIQGVAEIIYQAYKKGGQIFVFGNGGSSATASHMVCDFKKGTSIPGKPRLRISCLSDNIPIFSAIGNDNSYENVFVEQLISQVNQEDVVIGISCSGNSTNVLKAIKYAKECGAITIGFTAFGGGMLRETTDKSINLTCQDFGQSEDIHLSLSHILTYLLKGMISND
jgi:D-sedoheptulose 7-phosphate isomerase